MQVSTGEGISPQQLTNRYNQRTHNTISESMVFEP